MGDYRPQWGHGKSGVCGLDGVDIEAMFLLDYSVVEIMVVGLGTRCHGWCDKCFPIGKVVTSD